MEKWAKITIAAVLVPIIGFGIWLNYPVSVFKRIEIKEAWSAREKHDFTDYIDWNRNFVCGKLCYGRWGSAIFTEVFDLLNGKLILAVTILFGMKTTPGSSQRCFFFLQLVAECAILDIPYIALHPHQAERQQEEFNMSKQNARLHYLIKLALLAAILLMMDMTGLAMIPLPGQYASIMTVPVAVGAMLLGPLAGGVLGTVMGCISFITDLKAGFSTLFLAGYTGGIVVLLSFLNRVIPRMLMGVCVGWLFKLIHRIDKSKTVSYYLGGIAAPLLNTLFYMTVLVLIFMNAPMLDAVLGPELMETFQNNVLLFVAAYVGVQALLEAIIGCVISGSVCKILSKVIK